MAERGARHDLARRRPRRRRTTTPLRRQQIVYLGKRKSVLPRPRTSWASFTRISDKQRNTSGERHKREN